MSGRPNRIKTSAFRQRCTIQQPTETQDAAGQPVVTWSDFLKDEPCQFVPSGGTENMRGRRPKRKSCSTTSNTESCTSIPSTVSIATSN